MLLAIYSILAFLYWLFLMLWLIINGRKIKYLSRIPNEEVKPAPSLVIIIAVRNEERALRQALVSVCNLNYDNYRVLVINDRSTDNSGKILSELGAKYERLTVANINTLPPGWLGKNHALYTGYKFSEEEYMLFTDADVLYHKDAVNKAMNFCLKNNLDHLTILPGIISPSSILKSVLLTFIIMLTALQRPWAARKKNSTASMGVGAFNLVKRQAYERAGTHEAIAMRPDDDLKLAAAIKAAGGVSDVLYGQGYVELEWYANVKEFMNGLMKNAFSGFNYNVAKVSGGVLGTLLFFVLPLPVILVAGTYPERILVICIFLLQVILYWKMPGSNGKWWYGCMSIYGGIIMTYIILKSCIVTLYNGGIYWRDTFYSLTELRKNK